MKMLVGAALAAVLAGCSPSAEKEQPASAQNLTTAASESSDSSAAPSIPAAEAPADRPGLALASDGLTLVSEGGSSRSLAFGRAEAEVIGIVTAALGAPPERGINEECGAGPLGFANYRDGLNLLLDDGRFVGWSLSRDARELSTMSGIGIGSTRRDLDAAYQARVEESTLGQEFSAGELGGILSSAAPDGRVEALWAGVTCMFR